MAASKGGHDDKIGGNVRVIKFRDDGAQGLNRPQATFEMRDAPQGISICR
jgi:hypothetical protein